MDFKKWAKPIILLYEQYKTNVAFIHSLMQLVMEIFNIELPKSYEGIAPLLVQSLRTLVFAQDNTGQHSIYGLAAPWTQIASLELINRLPLPVLIPIRAEIQIVLGKILQ